MSIVATCCLAISLIAAVLGVGGMANPISAIAEMLFLLFAALFVISVIFGDRPQATHPTQLNSAPGRRRGAM